MILNPKFWSQIYKPCLFIFIMDMDNACDGLCGCTGLMPLFVDDGASPVTFNTKITEGRSHQDLGI